MDVTNIQDQGLTADQYEYMIKLIIPEAIRKLSTKLRVYSKKTLPGLNSTTKRCLVANKFLKINTQYNQPISADYLVFVGIFDSPGNSTLAFASYCAQGIFYLINFSKIFFKNTR